MKKALLIFAAIMVACPDFAHAATVVKKAAPVTVQQKSAMDSTSSLLPSILGVVSAVKDMSAKTKALTEECIPTAAEITFVNDGVKEWAKTGAMSAAEAAKNMGGMKPCRDGYSYERTLRDWADENDESVCFDVFSGPGNAGMIWAGYPMASKATYCADGGDDCSASNRKTASNIYEVFHLIDFDASDYTTKEYSMASKLIEKIEKCSSTKISAAKRAMWQEFLVNTMGSLGQPTNTGAIMEQVGAISSSGLGGGLSSLSGLAGQFLNK